MKLENDVLNFIVITNFFEMLKRKKIEEIKAFMGNSKNITSLLTSLGMNGGVFEIPAHREQIEKCFENMMESIFEVIHDMETCLKVEYLGNRITSLYRKF